LHSYRKKRRVGQSVKTPPFHGGMTSSTLVRGTERTPTLDVGVFVYHIFRNYYYIAFC
jgi:hypothetical protein